MGFIMLRLARVVSQFPAQYFGKITGVNHIIESLLGFEEFFPRLSAISFKWAREREVKFFHVVYEFLLVSYLFFLLQIWYFRK